MVVCDNCIDIFVAIIREDSIVKSFFLIYHIIKVVELLIQKIDV